MTRRFVRACALLASYVALTGTRARWSRRPAHLNNALVLLIVSLYLALPSLMRVSALPRGASRQRIGQLVAGTLRGAALGAAFAALIVGASSLLTRDDGLSVGGLFADTTATAAIFAAAIHALALSKRRTPDTAPAA